MKNKRIFSAYAKGADHNPKESLIGLKSQTLSDMSLSPNRRIGCVGVIFLSVGENGHVYEELLAETFDEFVVEITPARQETIEVIAQKPSRGSAQRIAAIEMNRENDSSEIKTGRRIILAEDIKHE